METNEKSTTLFIEILNLKWKGMWCKMGRPKIDRTGEVGVNNDGEKMEIIRYGGKRDIDVQFQDGTIVEHREYCTFKRGSIKNPMTPSVWGVGFIGMGKFKTHNGNGKPTRCYIAWCNMLHRCYSSKHHEKEPTYFGCTVCKEWHNFQVFAKWYYENYYEFGNNERMNLDKDILKKGNKIYSPDSCTFVPQCINALFIKSNKVRGNCPIGVYEQGDKFVAQLSKGSGIRIYLGTFNTPKEAFLAYKKAKEEYIKEVAEKYKSQIPQKLYDALMNYDVDIDD